MLLKVDATAVNRADILQRYGKYPPPKDITKIIGLEAVGQVVAQDTLEPVSDQKYLALLPGGSYAQYVNVNKDHIIAAPKNLDLAQLAAIPEVWLTAYQLIHMVGKGKQNETALILAAASGVGTSLI